MTLGCRADEAAVAESAATVIARLSAGLGNLIGGVQQMLLEEVPDLQGDARLMELLHDTVETNIDTAFSVIRHNISVQHVEPPTAALEHARRLAQRGVSVDAMVRGYRLGHKAVLDAVLGEVRDANLDSPLALEVFGYIAETTFGYIDSISQQVVAAYQEERDRWLENRNSMRALQVRELLDGSDSDADAMTAAIRYPLRRIHLAAAVWYDKPTDGRELVALERYVQQFAESINTRESPLFIPVDSLTGWAWFPLEANTAEGCMEAIHAVAATHPDAPWTAVGTPLEGVKGFRRSHLQAQDARAVALALGSEAPRVVAASDPGLAVAALVGSNIDAARSWVAEVLGPLACRTDSDERLRTTLRIFLRCGSSFKAAAEELHLHHNSVKYRVQRAVARRGRPISDDRLDVEVALLMCRWYGVNVLQSG